MVSNLVLFHTEILSGGFDVYFHRDDASKFMMGYDGFITYIQF